MAGSQLWRISIQRLGRDLSEASELATVFQEVSPDLQVQYVAFNCVATRTSLQSDTGIACLLV